MHTDAQECTRTRMGKNNTTFGGKKTLHPSPSVASTPESQVARHHEIRSRRAQLMRAVRSGVIDCRSNAPEIALWRPLLVENRPGEARVVPGALSDVKKVILTFRR